MKGGHAGALENIRNIMYMIIAIILAVVLVFMFKIFSFLGGIFFIIIVGVIYYLITNR